MTLTKSPEGSLFAAGLAAYRAGRFLEARELLESDVRDRPLEMEPRHVLALALRGLGLISAAVDLLQEVVEGLPSDHEAWSNYGAVLRQLGRHAEAETALKTSLRLQDNVAATWNNLATVHMDRHEPSQAEACLVRALELEPNNAEALTNMSRIRFEAGDVSAARALARTAVSLDPKLAEAQNRLSIALCASGDVEGGLKAVRRAWQADPGCDRLASNVFLKSLASDTVSSLELLRDTQKWGKKYALVPSLAQNPSGSLQKIGFVSGDFCDHPVGRFVAPVLERIAKHVQVHCYSTKPATDQVRRRLVAAAHTWSEIGGESAEAAAKIVFGDQNDVLIDLSGHTGDHRLDVFAHQPAPIQLTWLGYSGTVGLRQVGHLVGDPVLIPIEHHGHYSESILTLPHSFLCVEPLASVPEGVHEDRLTFGVFNNPGKFSDTMYRLWIEVLKAEPRSDLRFTYHNMTDPWVQRSIRNRFLDEGIEGERIQFSQSADRSSHLRAVASVTVALDTFPYSGATTTLDCLQVGTPVVTLAGDRYSSRMSASLLSSIGAGGLVCRSEADYVDCALRQASLAHGNACGSAEWRDMFRDSPLCDLDLFADQFLQALTNLAT